MIKNRVVLTKLLLSLSIVGLLVSCGGDKPKNVSTDEKAIEREIEKIAVHDFEIEFSKLDTTNFEEGLKELEKEFPLFFASQRPVSEWKLRYVNAPLAELSDSLIILFDKDYKWETGFNKAMAIYQKEFVNDVLPEVFVWNSAFEMNTGVWAYNNNLILAMEQYLGKDHPYYGQFPNYIAFQKDSKFIVTDLVSSFAESKVVRDPEDFTFLNKLISKGKAYYFTQVMLPGTKDEDLLKYEPAKMDWLEENEAEVWKYFINQELLFSTDSKPAEQFLAQAPFSKFNQPFDNKTPGRVAEWMGLQIIRSLAENNPEMSLETIMGINDAQSILTLSRYKP